MCLGEPLSQGLRGWHSAEGEVWRVTIAHPSGSDVTMAPQSEGSVQPEGAVGGGGGIMQPPRGGPPRHPSNGKGSGLLPPSSAVTRVADSLEDEEQLPLGGGEANGPIAAAAAYGESRRSKGRGGGDMGEDPQPPSNVYFDSSQQSGRRPQK